MSVPTVYVPSWSMVAAGAAGAAGAPGPGGGGAGGSAIAVPAETQQPARASVAATIAALHGLTTETVRGGRRRQSAVCEQQRDSLLGACQGSMVPDERRFQRLDSPPHHSCGPASSDDDIADARPHLVTDSVAEPSGGDRLVPGHHPRPLGHGLPPRIEHRIGGAAGSVHMPGPRLPPNGLPPVPP